MQKLQVKKVKKNTIVVLGGNHISSMVTDYNISLIDKNSNLPDFIEDLENDHFDMALTGEGEFSFTQLVNALLNGSDISKIPGLVKKIGNKKILVVQLRACRKGTEPATRDYFFCYF